MAPAIGPPIPITASFHADLPSAFAMMSAPMKGMKIGAEIGSPWRQATKTWPISWTKIRSTTPAAKLQPNASE